MNRSVRWIQGCKKFFFRSEHKISCWKIAPAISQNSLLFGGFWPISIVTWLELVFLKKSETDLTEFAYKWLHLFRKFMPTLKNRSGWLKFAPSNARVLAHLLHPCTNTFYFLSEKEDIFNRFQHKTCNNAHTGVQKVREHASIARSEF